MQALPFIVVPLVAFILAYGLTPLSMRLAHRWGAVQIPKRERDIHRGAMPRLGGVAIGVAFMVAALLSRTFTVSPPNANEAITFQGLILGSAIMLIFGVLDDKWELPAWPQFAVQFAVAAIAISHDLIIEYFNNPITDSRIPTLPLLATVLLTTFWFVGTMNTVNWLDGLDGLADGVLAIASAVFAAHMAREGQYSVALLALALFGATVGVLPFNFNPARTFIGSSGSFFLGYALAALAVIAGAKVATLLFVLGLPILDTAWQIVSRLRRGQNPFKGDRGHMHQRLLDAGFSQKQIVVGYYIFCIL